MDNTVHFQFKLLDDFLSLGSSEIQLKRIITRPTPTIVQVAIAGIDDAASVAIFGILSSLVFNSGSLAYQISQAPVCVIGGLLYGVVWGKLDREKKHNNNKTYFVLRAHLLKLFAMQY